MRTVVITEDFTGYPAGNRRSFAKGEEVEVSEEFADLVVGKGHAREKTSEAAASKVKKETRT